ncbi:SAC3/GANP/Nin1/mts3/eIF-3 p25 family-domain-containing protein [Naematelia encephala]|uniref:SAC3/GANP/Nin1/mts3/eIF-3 p25 family-domain-containing protein n=1 Tax=Naematelia encephala TaxID=71784 RepID=A0A1Y2BH08_9TREE|nr:SAC3/GANP/Nin1/mts3/eIF-3 p25 family-domain-containing protein [Naematelia encephala]
MHLLTMSSDLQQSLTELQQLFDKSGGSKAEVSQRLVKLKLELAQSGLYFAPPSGNVQDLVATRSILELGAFHSLRIGNLKAYRQYNSSLQPFYDNLSSILPPSPNRPITLGLHLLSLLSEGELTQFHTTLETLQVEQLNDAFVRLPVDLERWLMEGSYNRVYRARDRVPREEFGFLLERLMGTVRAQIAATIEASYPSLALESAATLLFYKSGENAALVSFAASRGWVLQPHSQIFTFPTSSKPDIAIAAESANANVSLNPAALDALHGKGIAKGVPMATLVGPALHLAQQLEAIV